MQLVLEVCGSDGGAPVPLARKVFDRVGGVIGRGSGCDWVIHDPSRLLSSHHGLIGYREGRYFLTDISRNGIGVAGSPERLRKGQARPISHGDVFQLGALVIRAGLMEAQRGPEAALVGAGGPIPDDAFLGLDPLQTLDLEQQRQVASNELQALSESSEEPGAWQERHAADRAFLVMPRRAEPPVEAATDAIFAPGAAVEEPFWTPFAAALGMDLDHLDGPGRAALAIKVAHLFRVAIEGLQQNLRTREALKNELMPASADRSAQRQNPLAVCVDTPAVLTAMLGAQALDQCSAERAITQAHQDGQIHQVALLAACRSALRHTHAVFAPGHLLLSLESQRKPSRFFSDAGYWRAYQRHYQRLAEDDQFNDPLLGREFTRAYEEQVHLASALHIDYPG
ncbi:type VI secretion system-associated FHA domain protein TagH [Pseudomonas palleroniana]|uniref:type VI secretion system-associated FHA domain protein TagH n=1 Tax=Pseudomonas palleroniana TaxID=191390 RepID=UPI001FCC61F3|nr:type VI secretion system-associated FHA domain protein TagH [Pseudomonas palleroniana]UOK41024.1 type VI secretion system-associated FHA domain protein TagH [Pseudomonas palleroniana]